MGNTVLNDGPDDDDDGDVGMDLDRPNTGRGRQAPADDTDDDDDDAGDDDGDDDRDAEPADKDKKPADDKKYSQGDIDKLQGSLTAARKDARTKIADLRKQLNDLKKAQKPAPDTDDAVAKAREEATEEAVRTFKPIAVRAAAKASFLEAKLLNPTEARVSRLVKQLDMDAIDVDPDDGLITGLDEQVEALVEEYPELFGVPKDDADDPPPAARKKIPRGDGSDRRTKQVDESKLTTGEKHERRLLGNRR